MNILHLNNSATGGAARAAIRLHEGLNRLEDVSSLFAVNSEEKHQGHAKPQSPPPESRLLHPFLRRWRQRGLERRYAAFRPYTFHTDCRTRLRPEHLKRLLPADIINLHWIAHFIDWETCLPWLAQQASLVWTLHDMNPFSGIWHYEPGADENTPAMRQWNDEVFELKRQALAHIPDKRLTVVGPSRWIADQAGSSDLLGRFSIKIIPYGLDTDIFKPLDQKLARTALGLEEGVPLVGFIAASAKDPRKGLSFLFEALKALPANQRPQLLVAGANSDCPDDLEVTALGHIQSDRILRLFYSALDLFVCPSLQDNLPNTVLEAMACGRPVVGFEIGGLPDMIRPGETGWLVKTRDGLALSRAIQEALRDRSKLSIIGSTSREIAVAEFSSSIQARRYRSLYSSLCVKSPTEEAAAQAQK